MASLDYIVSHFPSEVNMRRCIQFSVAFFLALSSANGSLAVTNILTVSLQTNDIIYDPVSDTIYASVPSSAGLPNGNSIVPINPVTGALGAPIFVGSEPNRLAVSDNGQYLYVALDGAAQVRRVNLFSKTAEIQFPLGSSNGPLYAQDLEVLPGQPNSIAASRKNPKFIPSFAGVAIYDDGAIRPTIANSFTGPNVIEFGASPSVLYGFDNQSSDFKFYDMTVSASGITTSNSFSSVFFGNGVEFEVAGGIAYSTNGRAMNPDTGGLLGTFNTSGSIEPDTNNGRMYVLSSTNAIVPFSLTTFVPFSGTLAIPGVSGSTSSLIQFESDGLAFRSTGGQVFLIHDSDLVPVPEPSAIWLAVCGSVLLLSGFARSLSDANLGCHRHERKNRLTAWG